MSRKYKTIRNRMIYRARQEGENLEDIAADFDMSFQRVQQIIREESTRQNVEEE